MTTKRNAIWTTTILPGALWLGPALVLAQDRVAQICDSAKPHMLMSREVCECALNASAKEANAAGFAFYADTSIAYFELEAEDRENENNWDKAVSSAAETHGLSHHAASEIIDSVGRIHRDAIGECQG